MDIKDFYTNILKIKDLEIKDLEIKDLEIIGILAVNSKVYFFEKGDVL